MRSSLARFQATAEWTYEELIRLQKKQVEASENLVIEAKRQSEALEDMAAESVQANLILRQIIQPSTALCKTVSQQVEILSKNMVTVLQKMAESSDDSNGGYSSSTNTEEAEEEYFVRLYDITKDESDQAPEPLGAYRTKKSAAKRQDEGAQEYPKSTLQAHRANKLSK